MYSSGECMIVKMNWKHGGYWILFLLDVSNYLTQHLEDGYPRGLFTGADFVDMFAAYDIVNHRILIQKLYKQTQDSTLCKVFQNMLSK